MNDISEIWRIFKMEINNYSGDLLNIFHGSHKYCNAFANNRLVIKESLTKGVIFTNFIKCWYEERFWVVGLNMMAQ